MPAAGGGPADFGDMPILPAAVLRGRRRGAGDTIREAESLGAGGFVTRLAMGYNGVARQGSGGIA